MAAGIGIGFLVGSVVLLAVVLYYTRIRSSAVPHAGTVETDRETPNTEQCELCERERICEKVNDLTICAECREELMT